MASPIVIIGAGGFGREVRDWLLNDLASRAGEQESHEFLGFLDDGQPDSARLERLGARHLGGTDWLRQNPGARYYVAIGDPSTRQRIVDVCDDLGGEAGPPLVHPSAVVGSDVTLGAGTIVCPMAVITTNIRLGRHVHLNLTTTVGHDTVIGNYVTVNPGATISGDVTLEDGVMIGTGASVNQGLSIGSGSTIGAGAAAVKDIGAGVTAVGVPAKPR